ncbi:MAG: sulfite reductase [Gallionellales bacterium GWA2_59_43]|nr:MAG: sulfite reductase [Gallionellales bacterium GWA2_59_43]
MYHYDQYDHQLAAERVAQFSDQVRRRLSGELREDEFRVLRLQNGLYHQVHGYMLRIAVPYGLVSAGQVRTIAHIARKYDRGYGHLTTRQNIQFNWIKLQDVPEIFAELARAELHATQTSGSCIRGITSDEFAGVARDEIVDPRPYAEILRQWSTFHPEFAYLPRKFKIAISGGGEDRAATGVHDIGLRVVKNEQGEVGFRVLVGGGLGRTPVVGTAISDFVPWQHALTYLESIVRVYNEYGRRDNAYKARIKILVKALGIEEFRRQVEADWEFTKGGAMTVTEEELKRVAAFFAPHDYAQLLAIDAGVERLQRENKAFSNWLRRNVKPHKAPGYAIVLLSLKKLGVAPGDITADQLDAVAALSERFSFGEVRVTHMQNLVLADVRQSDLIELWQEVAKLGLATPNIGLLTDVICCPGSDFCSLANARSIPLAQEIANRFDDFDYLHDIGDIELNISGCINACAHHHVGHIGILGVDKNGENRYQISIGGAQGNDVRLGQIIGSSFSAAETPEVIASLLDLYVRERHEGERFVDTVHRLGVQPFKEHVYKTATAVSLGLADEAAAHAESLVASYDDPYFSPRF